MQTQPTQQVHEFEAAGLGKAPFQLFLVTAEGDTKCCYCETHIKYRFYIRSADGKEFWVGSDCVAKTSDMALRRVVKGELKKITEKTRREKQDLKTIAIIESGKLPFGKYTGKTFEEVGGIDPQYLVWMHNADINNGIVAEALKIATKPWADKVAAEKAVKQAGQATLPQSVHIGTVGEKIELELTVVMAMAAGFPGSSLLIFADAAGNRFKAYYSGSEEFGRDGTYKIRATVKEHTEYKGVKQTALTRIKKV